MRYLQGNSTIENHFIVQNFIRKFFDAIDKCSMHGKEDSGDYWKNAHTFPSNSQIIEQNCGLFIMYKFTHSSSLVNINIARILHGYCTLSNFPLFPIIRCI